MRTLETAAYGEILTKTEDQELLELYRNRCDVLNLDYLRDDGE
jgi:hypothetical protein